MDARAAERELGEQLAGWGKVAILETRGRRTGEPIRTPVGYAEASDGSILVAAGGLDTHWGLNLLADPACTVAVGERVTAAFAEPLEGPDHARAIRALILKYGTPAERLGRGPSFRLRPLVAEPGRTG